MRYRIADLIVEMSPKGRTAAQAEVDRTSARRGAADITIRVGGAQALSLCPELETLFTEIKTLLDKGQDNR